MPAAVAGAAFSNYMACTSGLVFDWLQTIRCELTATHVFGFSLIEHQAATLLSGMVIANFVVWFVVSSLDSHKPHTGVSLLQEMSAPPSVLVSPFHGMHVVSPQWDSEYVLTLISTSMLVSD
ncbi:hypothetical protein ABBQ32_005225 [Trebouxia sp. C0010 RCD-2024]